MSYCRRPMQPRLFEPEPPRSQGITVACIVHLQGPADRAEFWLTLTDTTTGQQMACWSVQGTGLATAAACASEILADTVRTALDQLSPF